jgi:hypothetical protein
MRTVLQLCILFAFLTVTSFAQSLPNAGFENWSNGNPDGWATDNVVGFAVPVTQSGESHGGSSAARLEVADYNGAGYPPSLTYSDAMTFSQLPASLTFHYKFSPLGNDALIVSVVLYKGDITGAVAAGTLTIGSGSGSYIHGTVQLEYYSNETPENAYIIFAVGDTSDNSEIAGTIGSFALIDDITFDAATAVNDDKTIADKFELQQNYPNPFNPVTNFTYSIKQQGLASLKIYDILGNEAAVVFNEEKEPGEYTARFNAAGMSSGVYFAKLTSGSSQVTKKIILMK